MEAWLQLVQTLGVAGACLVTLWVGITKILIWTGKEIIIPVRDQYLKQTADSVARLEADMIRFSQLQSTTQQLLEERTQKFALIVANQGEMKSLLINMQATGIQVRGLVDGQREVMVEKIDRLEHALNDALNKLREFGPVVVGKPIKDASTEWQIDPAKHEPEKGKP